MCKQISIIFVCIVSFLTISGCGIKGPLYQTPSKKVKPTSTEKVELSSTEKTNLNSSTRKR